MSQYVPVIMAMTFAALVAASIVGLSLLAGRGRLSPPRKTETYESGMPLLDTSRKRQSVRFFVVAMVFIIFDVEVALLLPCAIAARTLLAEGNTTVMGATLIFLVLLAIADIYLWREGAFDWSRRGTEF